MVPKDVCVLILGTCNCYSKRDFSHVIEDFEMGRLLLNPITLLGLKVIARVLVREK